MEVSYVMEVPQIIDLVLKLEAHNDLGIPHDLPPHNITLGLINLALENEHVQNKLMLG